MWVPPVSAEKDNKDYPINRDDILQIQHSKLSTDEQQNLRLVFDYQSLLAEYGEKQ